VGSVHVRLGFYNTGLTLPVEGFTEFENEAYTPIVCMFLIVVGNVGFPVALRLVIWIMFKVTPVTSRMHESLGFLLDHPRRCFTMLFPSGATWWLFGILVAMNLVDIIMFLALDINNPAFTSIIGGYKFMCGLFQAISLRTCGFTIISLSAVNPAVRITYIIMMYISAYPVAISIRRTNVYEEQSLGIFYDDESEPDGSTHHVSSHLRRQLGHDLWFISLMLIIICIAEGSRIQSGDIEFFSVLFEAVSAYGTVGASVGYGTSPLSLSGQFNVIGKLCIMALMIRGRHRGLPYKIDRAVMLKRDSIQRHDSVQETRTRNIRRLSSAVPTNDFVQVPLLGKIQTRRPSTAAQ
jgi:potassium uptake Trk family protein